MKKAFYLVWNPESGYTRCQHRTPEEAQAEAERLARLHKGATFIVLTPVGGAVSNDIQRLDFEHDDGIPF